MEAKTQTKDNTITLDELTSVLDSGAIIQARNLLNSLYPSEIADVIESSPRNRRDLIWNLVSNNNRGETLAELSEEVRGNLLDELIDESGTEGLAKIAENLDTDDLADIIQSLPKNLITKTIKSLDKQNQDRLAKVLSFSDDTAGGLMNTDTINIRSSVTVEVLLKYLRRLKKLPEQTDIVFVTDIMDKYFGYVSVQDLLVANTGSLVSEIMTEDNNIINPDMDAHEVARIFENHDLVSAAVVNKDGILLGRITVDDVVDIIRDEADDSVLNMAGLNKEDDIFAPIIQSTKRRTIWLGANLITAILAAAAIGIFEATIEKVVTLADQSSEAFKFTYDLDMPLIEKIESVARNIYGAKGVSFQAKAKKRIEELEDEGYGSFPVCIAKTQYSFSSDPKLRGAPDNHVISVREIRLSAGAEFIVVVCGDIMTMPGLPKVPAANTINLTDEGLVQGLF